MGQKNSDPKIFKLNIYIKKGGRKAMRYRLISSRTVQLRKDATEGALPLCTSILTYHILSSP